VNVFNRIVVVLLLLIGLLVAALLAVFPIQSLEVARQGLGLAAESLRGLEGTRFWVFMLARILLVLGAALVSGLLLWVELRPPRIKTVRVHNQAGDLAEVTADSVARRLTWHIDQLADVVGVVSQVYPHGRSVDVLLDLETAPDIDVPMKTQEVVACARDIIVERMGLQAGKIQVRITHAPYREEA
jgi:hypothetical protein